MNKILVIIFSLIFLSAGLPLFAETIILKSGKIVEGKIIEKTDKYIKVDIVGVTTTYYLDSVGGIDGNKISPLPAAEIAKEKETLPDNANFGNDGSNEEIKVKYGTIKILRPQGWQREENSKNNVVAYLLKTEAQSKLARITVVIVDLGSDPGCSLSSYQKLNLDSFKNKIEGNENCEGAEYTELFGGPAIVAKIFVKDASRKSKIVCFIKDCKYYMIEFRGEPKEYFDALLPEAENMIDSIELVK